MAEPRRCIIEGCDRPVRPRPDGIDEEDCSCLECFTAMVRAWRAGAPPRPPSFTVEHDREVEIRFDYEEDAVAKIVRESRWSRAT